MIAQERMQLSMVDMGCWRLVAWWKGALNQELAVQRQRHCSYKGKQERRWPSPPPQTPQRQSKLSSRWHSHWGECRAGLKRLACCWLSLLSGDRDSRRGWRGWRGSLALALTWIYQSGDEHRRRERQATNSARRCCELSQWRSFGRRVQWTVKFDDSWCRYSVAAQDESVQSKGVSRRVSIFLEDS